MATNPVDDQSYTYTADVLAGPLFFGAIGYGLDQWVFQAGHRWVIVGLILGIVMGLYAAFVRYRRSIAAIETAERTRRQSRGGSEPQLHMPSANARTESVPAEQEGVFATHRD